MFPVLKQNLSSQKFKDGREMGTAVTTVDDIKDKTYVKAEWKSSSQ
jgi:hypothetical protein